MKGMRNVALTILLFCSSILAWELIVRAFEVPTFIFPAPSKVAMALWRGFASGLYQKHLYYTLLETVLVRREPHLAPADDRGPRRPHPGVAGGDRARTPPGRGRRPGRPGR